MKEIQAEAVESERGRRGRMSWTIGVFVAFVVYVLSTGPVVRLVKRSGSLRAMKVANAAYAPLEFVYHRSAAVKGFFDWYFCAWGAP